MTHLRVTLGARVICVAFEHPWKFGPMHGIRHMTIGDQIFDVQHRITNCAVMEEKDREKRKYKFIGHGTIKWPLVAPDVEDGTRLSRTTLPKEKLSKDTARKAALAKAMKDTVQLTKTDRTAIWAEYFKQFPKAGVKVFMPPTPAAPVQRQAILLPESSLVAAKAGGHSIVNRIMPVMSWMTRSELIH